MTPLTLVPERYVSNADDQIADDQIADDALWTSLRWKSDEPEDMAEEEATAVPAGCQHECRRDDGREIKTGPGRVTDRQPS